MKPLLLSLLLATCTFSLAAERRPNILWLSCEDISAHLGCYGDDQAVTPVLDELAAGGSLHQRFCHRRSLRSVSIGDHLWHVSNDPWDAPYALQGAVA